MSKLPPFEAALDEAVGDCQTLLDVGCGSGSPIRAFSQRLHAVGVDAFEKSLEESRQRKIHQEYVKADIRELGQRFSTESFDSVVALDVIEHLPKEDGFRLLEAMEKIARKRVIVFTPNGFLPQGEFESNPWQVHLSGWTASEMRARGYRVIGLRGWRPLRGEYATIRFRPKFLWLFLSSLTQLWTKNHPDQAFQILCVLDKTATSSTPKA